MKNYSGSRSGGSKIFQMWAPNPTFIIYYLAIFLLKLHENERNWTEGEDIPSAPLISANGVIASQEVLDLTPDLMNVIIFLLFFYIPLGSFPCGPGCKCYTDNRERALVANCSFLGLSEVPSNLPNYTNWLFLSGNNIYSLSENVSSLPFLSFLTTVDLSQNNLHHISDKIFNLFTHCYSLDVSNNNLTTLSENVQNIKSLKNLKISGNTFRCQCNNLWIRDWLKRSEITNDYPNVTCDWPSGERIYLDHLDEEDLDCSSLSAASSSMWKTLGKIFVSFICLIKQIKLLCRL